MIGSTSWSTCWSSCSVHKKLTPTFFRCVLKMGVSSLLSSLYREARLDPLSRRSHVTKTGYQRENEVQEPHAAAGSGMASGGDAWFPVSSIPKTWSESPFKDTVFHFALCVRKKRFRDFSHAPRPQKSPPIPHRSRFFSLFTCKFRKMPINAMSERYEPD